MFRSLRNRLILSHILPLILVSLLTGMALVYVLETRFLLPRLADNLTGDARLLAEISRSEFDLWGNPVLFGRMLDRVDLDPAVRVMFLDPEGQMLYSSESGDVARLGVYLEPVGLRSAQLGEEVVLTNYSIWRPHNVLLEVLRPVIDPQGQRVIGIVRLTYRLASAFELFIQFRYLIVYVLVFGLLMGAVLGSLLAFNISRPVRQVTQAIYDLAQGTSSEPLSEVGPEEIRAQIRAVNYLVVRLNSLEEARRQLLANLVHELGRPLGALRSAIQAIDKGAGARPAIAGRANHRYGGGSHPAGARIGGPGTPARAGAGAAGAQPAGDRPGEWLPACPAPLGRVGTREGAGLEGQHPGRSGAGLRRPGAAVAGGGQPGKQCDQIYPYRRPSWLWKPVSTRICCGCASRIAVPASRSMSRRRYSSPSSAAARDGASSRAWAWV